MFNGSNNQFRNYGSDFSQIFWTNFTNLILVKNSWKFRICSFWIGILDLVSKIKDMYTYLYFLGQGFVPSVQRILCSVFRNKDLLIIFNSNKMQRKKNPPQKLWNKGVKSIFLEINEPFSVSSNLPESNVCYFVRRPTIPFKSRP